MKPEEELRNAEMIDIYTINPGRSAESPKIFVTKPGKSLHPSANPHRISKRLSKNPEFLGFGAPFIGFESPKTRAPPGSVTLNKTRWRTQLSRASVVASGFNYCPR